MHGSWVITLRYGKLALNANSRFRLWKIQSRDVSNMPEIQPSRKSTTGDPPLGSDDRGWCVWWAWDAKSGHWSEAWLMSGDLFSSFLKRRLRLIESSRAIG